MTTSLNPQWLDAIGMMAAVIAFACAVYLQLIVRKQVRPRYVIAFLGIGFALFLLTVRLWFFPVEANLTLRMFGYITFIILELYGLKVVVNETNT